VAKNLKNYINLTNLIIMASVSTYLNFSGNTEAAFLFYKSVFKTEFVNNIQRFEDLPANPSQPPMQELGFNLTQGNNMHIQLAPNTKEEATQIFNDLSEGGVITMPLQDMFWGAYFGSCTDKFGINWMINFYN
jgi:PhnB protein